MIPPELAATGLGPDDPRPYSAIAAAAAALVARTGQLGLGGAFAGRQLVARWFLGGWANAAQRRAWLEPIAAGQGLAAVAISEPGVGAHPKHLTTRAAALAGGGWRVTGRKAWVSNGPLASLFVVLAVEAEEDGRKRYGAFLVPRATAGLQVEETEEYRALAPSRHCLLVLDGCEIGPDARLGPPNTAYETMALPFRDVEDAVGLAGLGGACRFLAARLREAPPETAEAEAIGAVVALTALLQSGAAAIAAALDADRLAHRTAEAIGLRLLAAEIAARAERCSAARDPALARVLADLEASRKIARGPRAVRLARLATAPLPDQEYTWAPAGTSK
ncbi:MAG TPA: acyl-CoA dehydrogenase family protein [Acetobacteraceae bacterium]|nr:acyl-CoA dehydrogenase family protein [Acetobacteraceae bacterium]